MRSKRGNKKCVWWIDSCFPYSQTWVLFLGSSLERLMRFVHYQKKPSCCCGWHWSRQRIHLQDAMPKGKLEEDELEQADLSTTAVLEAHGKWVVTPDLAGNWMNGGDGGICFLKLEAIWSPTEAFWSPVFPRFALESAKKSREICDIYIIYRYTFIDT